MHTKNELTISELDIKISLVKIWRSKFEITFKFLFFSEKKNGTAAIEPLL
jgi:hypothetical protein